MAQSASPIRAVVPTVLTLRTECAGGAVGSEVVASKDLTGLSRLTILIHGFNNAQCNAESSYSRFLHLDGIDETAFFAAAGELCEFFWPGDSPVFRGLSYPFEIPRAIESGQKLSRFLREVGSRSPVSVRLVCHSLGNRVALEMLKDYLQAGSPASVQIAGVVLMAPAVKVAMVESEDDLRNAALAAGASVVLFSEHDRTLRWLFPLGEFAAGEGFGTAVGRFGEPQHGVWRLQRNMDPYDHGDYWTKAATAAPIRSWLGLATARLISERSLLVESLPEPSDRPGRLLSTRVVGESSSRCACSQAG